MSDQFLELMEADVFGLLTATPTLALAKVLRADEGLTEADVAQKLSALSGATKAGLGIIVMQAEVVAAEKNLPGPRMRASISVQVIEAVLINRSANGTQIKASVAAIRVVGALHQARLGTTLLYADQNPIEPLPGKKGYVSYLVTLFAEQNAGAGVERVADVTAALSGSDIVLTCATAGAAIYFTTDGSFPGASNTAATLYSAPIPVLVDTHLRSAAYASPLNPSAISDDQITL